MLKISKGEAAVLLLAALFIGAAAGWFFRGHSMARPLRVEAQWVQDELTVLPEPSAAPDTAPVNLNTAGPEELQTLPGIGEKRAADIIADREHNGPFRYPEDLLRVPGIGEETLAGLIDYVTTEEEQP